MYSGFGKSVSKRRQLERKKTVPKRTRPVEEGILEAIRSLWPNGIPRGLKPKSRDNQTYKWLKDNGRSVGKDLEPSFSRAVQRVLKARPELLQKDAAG
jgi:hypothetical protein